MSAENRTRPRTALVIGGGAVGMACALNLVEMGLATTLVDPAGMIAASRGNAGHIAVEQVEPLASRRTLRSAYRQMFHRGGALSLPIREAAAWVPFALRFAAATSPRRVEAGRAALGALLGGAIPAWRTLLARVGAPDLLVEKGHFVVWEQPDEAARGRAFWNAAHTGTVSVQEARYEERHRIESQLRRPLAGAIRFTGSAHIADLDVLAASMEARFLALGGSRVAERARLRLRGNRAEAVLGSGESLTADMVLVAAGARSGALMAAAGDKAPLIAERGYHLQAAETDWPSDLPPVVFEARSLIVSRFRSGLRAASFIEFARPGRPPDPRKWARLRSHLDALGIAFREPVSEWMGERPTLPDYLPAIGRSRHAENLFYAFGHQHLGLTLAAVTGELVAQLAEGAPPSIDLAPFDLARF